MVNHSFKSALLVGISYVILSLVLYLISLDLYFSIWTSFLYVLIPIILIPIQANAYRKSIGGFLGYGNSFLYHLLANTGGLLIYCIFLFVLNNYINSELPVIEEGVQIKFWYEFLINMGIDMKTIQTFLLGLTTVSESYTAWELVKKFLLLTLSGAFLSLITALFSTKKVSAA